MFDAGGCQTWASSMSQLGSHPGPEVPPRAHFQIQERSDLAFEALALEVDLEEFGLWAVRSFSIPNGSRVRHFRAEPERPPRSSFCRSVVGAAHSKLTGPRRPNRTISSIESTLWEALPQRLLLAYKTTSRRGKPDMAPRYCVSIKKLPIWTFQGCRCLLALSRPPPGVALFLE